MLKICSNEVIAFDVDDTLIVEDNAKYTHSFKHNGQQYNVRVNSKLIIKLKELFNNKKTIVVWSQQGADWADDVVRGIGIENFVHYTMTKISDCYDDLPTRDWMKNHKITFE